MNFEGLYFNSMGRKLRHSIFLALCSIFASAGTALAADVRMSIEPELIGLLDRAILKIEFINTKGKAVDMPEIEGLQIQYNGQRSETRIVNMKRTSKVVHTYLVTPTQAGDFTIGPVLGKFKGGQKTVSAKLRVIQKANDAEAQDISEIMFSRITSNRDAPYVHEPFELNVDIYIRDDIQIDGNFRLRGGIPESGMEGELEWSVSRPVRKEQEGTVFKVYHLKTTAKTITAGGFEFKPEVQINVVIPRQNRRSYGFDDPFFGDMFGRQETRPFTLPCNTLQLDVKPVPMAGRPNSFTGGVGLFDFNVKIGPSAVKVGEPITIKTTVSGKGNLNQITPPIIKPSHNYKLYDARTIASKNPEEVRFEQVLIPTTDSVTNLPPIEFSYFNTTTADFRTLSKGPFPIEIEAMPQQAAQIIASVPSSIVLKTQVLGRDIVYLKSRPKNWISTTDIPWQQTHLAKRLLPLPALLLLLVTSVSIYRNRLAGNVALARRQKAPKAARRTIQIAEQALRKKNESAFYEALWNTLMDYFGHRLNLAPGEVTQSAVLTRIPSEARELEALFSVIEQHRYGMRSGESAPKEMKALLKQLTCTLRKCERMKL